jgi:valyl-tRNA synthetase
VKSGDCKVISASDADPAGCLKNFINDDITIFVMVAGFVDIKLEMDRVAKRNVQLQNLIDGLNKKITMKGYEEKVPEAVRIENQEKLTAYQTEITQNNEGLAELQKLM